MSSAAPFLRALARQLSTASLYGPSHPMLARGLASAFEELRGLTEERGDVVFEIQADRVLCDGRDVADLGAWLWRTKFREAGIARLEFEAGMDAPGFARRFHELAGHLGLYEAKRGEPEEIELEVVTLDSDEVATAVSDDTSRAPAAPEDSAPRQGAHTDETNLDESADLVRWIHGEIAGTGQLPSLETQRVVERVRRVVETGEATIASSLLLSPADGYTTSHCLSVAMMATALAAHLEYDGEELAFVTEAALLHDIGKARLPLDDTAPGGLTPEQRSVMERHPAEGARVLLAAPARHALSAVVAYEHHMAWQGETGYPARHYPRSPHRFSRLVQVCDAYDVLRTRRPFRASLSHEIALEYMRLQGAKALDPALVTAFTDLCGARPLPRVRDQEGDGSADGTVELSRMPDVAFDADTETPPIRL